MNDTVETLYGLFEAGLPKVYAAQKSPAVFAQRVKALNALVRRQLARSALPAPDFQQDPTELLSLVLTVAPAAAWLPVGATVAADSLERRSLEPGRSKRNVTLWFDRQRHTVAVQRFSGVPGAPGSYTSVSPKRYPTAEKANAAWAALLAKYGATGAGDPVVAKRPRRPTARPSPTERALQTQFWQNPLDERPLQVLADHWAERSDPRGEFVQLSLLAAPTPAQTARRESLRKRFNGQLLGPAREGLRQWEFGRNGLVHWAVTDAALLAQHREAIRWLNPRLALVVSTRDLAAVRELAKAPIDACFVALRTRLGDEALAALAPALADVKYLSLDGRDRPDRVFTPAGLAALGGHLRRLTYLELDSEPDDPDSPPLDAYLEVVTAVKGFRSLQVINVPEASPAQLRRLSRALPKVVRAVAISPFELETPRTVDDVERLLQPPKSRSR